MLKKILQAEYILASKSPRRKKLLRQIGLNFKIVNPRVIETEDDNNPIRTIKENAYKKANFCKDYKNKVIIGADTVVVMNKIVLHKPANPKQAIEYLTKLSERVHTVYTGVYIINNISNKEIFGYEKTYVKFRNLTKEEIRYYVKMYKPLDKAGAYGIQDDFGALFIDSIRGDYYNVVGLPLVKTYELIKRTFGFIQ